MEDPKAIFKFKPTLTQAHGLSYNGYAGKSGGEDITPPEDQRTKEVKRRY